MPVDFYPAHPQSRRRAFEPGVTLSRLGKLPLPVGVSLAPPQSRALPDESSRAARLSPSGRPFSSASSRSNTSAPTEGYDVTGCSTTFVVGQFPITSLIRTYRPMLALGMDTTLQIRSAVEQNIRTAFRGVTLGAGVTLRGASLIDSRSASSREQAQPLTQAEINGDWS
jgi:hypothetical protein